MPIVTCGNLACAEGPKGRRATFHIAPAHLNRLKRPPTCSPDCRAATMRGAGHWHWRGGRYLDDQGYVRVWTENGYMLEHRKVMAEKLGRPLRDDEVVHHVDENRENNDPANLILESDRGAHTLTHHVVRGAKGTFRRKRGSTPTKGAVQRQHKAAFTRLTKQHRRVQTSAR